MSQFTFAFQFFYIFAVAFVKLSILCFYRRVFTVNETPMTIWILLALTIGWLISFFFATIFQAWPMQCNWVECPNTTDYPIMYVMSSVTDIILDISILSLPTFFTWRLQMSSAKKFSIIGIFGLGILYEHQSLHTPFFLFPAPSILFFDGTNWSHPAALSPRLRVLSIPYISATPTLSTMLLRFSIIQPTIS